MVPLNTNPEQLPEYHDRLGIRMKQQQSSTAKRGATCGLRLILLATKCNVYYYLQMLLHYPTHTSDLYVCNTSPDPMHLYSTTVLAVMVNDISSPVSSSLIISFFAWP